MLGSIGPMELVLIFIVALLVFGPRKLPELGKSLGKGIAEFRRASTELRSTLEDEVRAEEQKEKDKRLPPPGTEAQKPSDAARPEGDRGKDQPPPGTEGQTRADGSLG